MGLEINEILFNLATSAVFLFVLFGIALTIEGVVLWLGKK